MHKSKKIIIKGVTTLLILIVAYGLNRWANVELFSAFPLDELSATTTVMLVAIPLAVFSAMVATEADEYDTVFMTLKQIGNFMMMALPVSLIGGVEIGSPHNYVGAVFFGLGAFFWVLSLFYNQNARDHLETISDW